MPDHAQPDRALVVESGVGSRILRIAGELDISTAPELEKAIQPYLEDDGDLVFDLSGLDFMDSSGIKVITNAARGLAGKGFLVLEAPGPLVRRVLELTKLDLIDNLQIRL